MYIETYIGLKCLYNNYIPLKNLLKLAMHCYFKFTILNFNVVKYRVFLYLNNSVKNFIFIQIISKLIRS